MKVRELIELLRVSFDEWWRDNAFRLAASLAFYTIFSMAPILLIAIGIAGFIFGETTATSHLVEQARSLVGTQGGRAVLQVIESARGIEQKPLALVIGFGTLFVGSTVVFAELQSALNTIWDVESHPEESLVRWLVRVRLRSFAIVLAVGFLLVVSLVFGAFLAGAQELLHRRMPGVPWLWRASNLVASFVLVSLLFAMIYRYLPDVKLTWRDVSVGALVTASLFMIGKYLIGFYLGQMAFGSTYGAAGSFVVLVIWVYYSALVSFYGAEFTQVFARRYGSGIQPQPYAVRVGRKADRWQSRE